jgi:predicted metal-dependent phosphoesterase TrpH
MGKADLHLHTTCSDGATTVVEMIEAVARGGTLDVIAITDHDTIAGAEVAQRLVARHRYPFEVIVGAEISSREGHIVGLFLRENVARGLSATATVAAIHAQGGLAFAAHPFFRDRPLRHRRAMDSIGALAGELSLDAIEVDNSTPFLERANARARRFAAARALTAIGASDAHIPAAIGKSYTTFPGATATDLRRAIAAGETRVGTLAYTPRELVAYFRFWCGHGRRRRDTDGVSTTALTTGRPVGE